MFREAPDEPSDFIHQPFYMSITISKFADQARDYHSGGLIKERKSISFESPVKGISNLFHWSTIWTDEGATLEERAHKGFEVISYITSGTLEHKPAGEEGEGEEWEKLEAGGVQVIRSGNGVAHTERYAPNTRIFQIWLDPDFRRSLQRPGAFANYDAEDFEVEEFQGMQRLDLMGDESPMWISTKVQLDRYEFGKGDFQLEVPADHVFSAVVISGSIQVGDETVEAGDLVQVSGETTFAFSGLEKSALFVVVNPLEPGYRTYTDQLQVSQ